MSPTLLKTGQLKPQGSSYPGTPVLKCIFGHLVFPKSLKHSCQTFWGFTTTVQSMETRYERAIQGELILNCHLHTILLDVLRHSPLVAHLCRGEAGFFQLLKKKKSAWKVLTSKSWSAWSTTVQYLVKKIKRKTSFLIAIFWPEQCSVFSC